MAKHIKNIIHYVCGTYPFDFGGVARFDSLLQDVFPHRIFMKAQEESNKLYNFCLENPLTTLVITDNQHACDVPQNIPCIIFHHGVARTHAERDPSWNKQVRDICVNGQDQMFEHRLPHNTIFISISKFCSDEFQRHYKTQYEKFRKFLLHVPVEKRISSEWALKKTKSNKYKFEDPFNMSTLTESTKPRILGDWSTANKGSEIIPKLQQILKDEFEFVQLKTSPTQNVEQHRKNVEAFYKKSQIYFQLSTSEGSSFASEDGLAYGLLVIASNVGQFYETPNHVASTFDWKQRTDPAFLAEKIRTSWKNRENYNPVEWMNENLDWIKWSTRLTEIVNNFVSSLNIRMISYPIVQRNPSIFWQHPVITEKYCLDRISQQPLTKFRDIYVGIPYATLIDRNALPVQEIVAIANQIKAIKSISPKGTRVYTACQHIHYTKMLDLMKMIGITDIFISHKRKGAPSVENGMNVYGLPLYPVNVFDEKRSLGISTESIKERDFLFSFIGAHMKHYINPIRKKLLSWHTSEKYVIQNTKMWHFEKNVYQEQVSGIKLSSSDLLEQDKRTLEYNRTLVNSTFSLCPVGAGPNTIRLWESICVGSIPVIIADEFNIEECIPKSSLPSEQFYIQLPYASSHLNNPEALVTYLKSISQEQINTMRKGCEQITEYLKASFISPPSA